MTDHAGEFLKCDTPTCDHYEVCPVSIENIGRLCPKCGSNLLTQEDFISFSILKASVDTLTQVALAANPDEPMVLLATNVHGNTIRAKVVENAGQNPFPNEGAA